MDSNNKTRKLDAELWDKTQFILSDFYDRMMHFALFYEGILDINIIRKSIDAVIKNVPVLHSQYITNIIKPYWLVCDYKLENLAKEVETKDIEKDTLEFLKGEISNKEKLQFKCTIFVDKENNKCAFATIVNHQCFDGSDYKYIMYKIIECYNSYIKFGNIDNITIKNGTRNIKQLYENMDKTIAEKAKGLYKNISQSKIKTKFKFTDDTNCYKCFIRNEIDADTFKKIKEKAKKDKVSINDVLIAAYCRSLIKEINQDNNYPVQVTSMMDLRRHMLNGGTVGATNMTAFMFCELYNGIGDNFKETLKLVKEETSKNKNDNVAGLHGIPLLNLAYKIFQLDFLATFAIKLGYNNPYVQMSNFGLLNTENINFEGCKIYDCLLTGAVKYKPYFQLTCVTLNDNLKFCIAEKCSKEDEKLIKQFLKDLIAELIEYSKD